MREVRDFEKQHGLALARGVSIRLDGRDFLAWQLGLMIPSIQYPSGAVQSASMIPAPNVPVMLMLTFSPGDLMFIPPSMVGVMTGIYTGMGGLPHKFTPDIFLCMSSAVSISLLKWKGMTKINGVLGAGGVAPPPPSPPGPVAGAMGNGGVLQ